MKEELLFRLIFIGVFVWMLLLSAYYRRLARKASGVIVRRQEGALAVVLRITLTLPLLLSIILYACNPRWMDWAAISLPLWVRWLGAGLGLACIAMVWWVLYSIGANISETVLTKQNHQLITKGPYRWVRHPLYSVGLLEIFALGLLASNWFMLVFWVIGIGVFRYVVIPKEEANLLAAFANDYRNYQKRTGALMPLLRA